MGRDHAPARQNVRASLAGLRLMRVSAGGRVRYLARPRAC